MAIQHKGNAVMAGLKKTPHTLSTILTAREASGKLSLLALA